MPHIQARNPHVQDRSDCSNRQPQVLTPSLGSALSALYASKLDMFNELRHMLPGMDYTYFMVLWRRHLWYVDLKTWSPFAKCDDCVNLRCRCVFATRVALLASPIGSIFSCKAIRALSAHDASHQGCMASSEVAM